MARSRIDLVLAAVPLSQGCPEPCSLYRQSTMGQDLEKGLDDASDPTRHSASDIEDARPQSPQPKPLPNTNSDASVPYGPQSVIVDWDGPDDPEFPQNWPLRKKWTITMVMVRTSSPNLTPRVFS